MADYCRPCSFTKGFRYDGVPLLCEGCMARDFWPDGTPKGPCGCQGFTHADHDPREAVAAPAARSRAKEGSL